MREPRPIEETIAQVAADHRRCVWLDGGGHQGWSGDRSLLAWLTDDDPSLTWHARAGEVRRHVRGESAVVGDDIFAALQAELRPGAQWFGYFGYASRTDLPCSPASSADVPDAVWMRPSQIRMFHHPPGRPASRSGALGHPGGAAEAREGPGPAYCAAFDRVQEALRAGDSYEVNLTYRETVTSPLSPAAAYLRLRAVNPAPYAGFLQHQAPGADAWLLSSSPERYATIDAARWVETKPIKGTTPRSADPEQDERAREALAQGAKFRAENLMIVDLLRNDLSMVCEPGTVGVPALMQVESYPSVHQLVSTIRGRLREEVGTVEALRALFPAGSMTGAPKARTMRIIDEVEYGGPRSAYSGAFGWISGDGPADLGVIIRSVFGRGDGRWRLGTGGGITVASDVIEEYAETRWKAERLIAALNADLPG